MNFIERHNVDIEVLNSTAQHVSPIMLKRTLFKSSVNVDADSLHFHVSSRIIKMLSL